MNGEFLSFAGLYKWDDTLFDGVQLPTQVDRTNFIFELLAETAELEVCYPDPEFMKDSLEAWSSIRVHSWQKIADALCKNYDPYINMTRDETRTITRNLNGSVTNKVNAWDSQTATEQSSSATTDGGTITDTFHSAGDSALYTPTDILGKEVAVREKNDLYKILINDFKSRYCLLVY
jgi:hypothetical protein